MDVLKNNMAEWWH